jgi:AcrR family transcriptional regulator
MVRPKRSEQTINLDIEIKAKAWRQIAEFGAAALSLRRIARALGIAAPSIYHYYPNRDALVTALILDAFKSLAETLNQSSATTAAEDYPEKLTTLARAYRNWAISQPQRYQLIFGTPIPGYVAPDEITLPAAAAGFVPLTETLQAALTAGRLRTDTLPPLTPALASMLKDWQQVEGRADREVLYLALIFWSRIHGLMMFEINGQFPSFITAPGEVFEREINMINNQYFGMERR